MSDSNLKFTVDSLLLGEIGERLVTKNYIALAELVKNAYDADATSITLNFINVVPDENNAKSKIEIIDTGNGMNFEQIQRFWMRIATDNKQRDPISPRFGRKKAGSKGIGRFACARLANKLILETTGKREKSNPSQPDTWDHTIVTFEWKKYEPGTILTSIKNTYTTETLNSVSSTGTTLSLIGLRDSWSPNDFAIMRRQILGLSVASGAKRLGFEEDPGFVTLLNAPNFPQGSGLLSDQVMNAGWGRLKGSVAEDGTATLDLEAKKIGMAHFVFPEKFREIAGTQFDIGIFWDKKEYCRDNKTLTLYSIEDIFKNWSGIKVFLDGFRIYPYGDIGDDWLGIDRRQVRRIGKTDAIFERVCKNFGVDETRALLNQPKNHNLLGKIYITNRLGAKFEVLINREGFVESKEVISLKSLLLRAIEWVTIHYDHFLYSYRNERLIEKARDFQSANKSKALLETKEDDEIPQVVGAALSVMAQVYDDYKEKVVPKEREEIAKQANTAMDVIEETICQMNRRITALHTMASAGALLLVLSHETRDVINRLGSIANSIKVLTIDPNSYNKQELTQLSNSIRETRDRLTDQLALFNNVSKSVSSIEKQKVHLHSLATESLSSFRGLNDEFKIEVDNAIPPELWTGPMLKGEVYSIFINLLSNAEKVTIAAHGHRIKVMAVKGQRTIALRFYDEGIGISPESQELVLKAGVPDPENRLYKTLTERLGANQSLSVGTGSGLGLAIVQEILKSYGQKIRFAPVESPWKTCVEVTLPI